MARDQGGKGNPEQDRVILCTNFEYVTSINVANLRFY